MGNTGAIYTGYKVKTGSVWSLGFDVDLVFRLQSRRFYPSVGVTWSGIKEITEHTGERKNLSSYRAQPDKIAGVRAIYSQNQKLLNPFKES